MSYELKNKEHHELLGLDLFEELMTKEAGRFPSNYRASDVGEMFNRMGARLQKQLGTGSKKGRKKLRKKLIKKWGLKGKPESVDMVTGEVKRQKVTKAQLQDEFARRLRARMKIRKNRVMALDNVSQARKKAKRYRLESSDAAFDRKFKANQKWVKANKKKFKGHKKKMREMEAKFEAMKAQHAEWGPPGWGT